MHAADEGTHALLGRIRIVEPDEHLPLIHLREILVQYRGLGMSDVEIPRRLGREPRVYEPARRGEVLLAQVRVDLRVLADFVEAPEEPLREDGFG